MKLRMFLALAVFTAASMAHAFGDMSEEKKEKMRKHKEACEKPLKSICGDSLEFPDLDKESPGMSMFKKINRLKACIKSEAVQKSDIPAECKKEIGPGPQ